MIRRLLQAMLCCLVLNGHAADSQLVFPQYFAVADSRNEFDWIVLRTALEKTRASHGAYSVGAWREPLSVPRMLQELGMPNGRINVIARATDRELEIRFNPIRIPIDRGLMGYRLLLVRRADLPRFAKVRTPEDLKRFSAGQGKGWIDTEVLTANRISVVESPRPESLYGMLEAGRFDFYPRALDEAHREMEFQRKQRPGIAIEPTLLLRYTLPRYFFVRRDAEGHKLAQRIKVGMEIMVQDGSLAALFRQHKGPMIERSAIGKRRIIDLPHPTLPPETPLHRSELWFKP